MPQPEMHPLSSQKTTAPFAEPELLPASAAAAAWAQDVNISKVEGTVLRGTTLNLVGMGATLVGLQVRDESP
jgi:hypothetical protein